MVGQQAHGPFGVGVVGDMDPQGSPALAGAIEVALEAIGVDGHGSYHLPGEAALGEIPLVVVQDLLAGVDPQVALGEPSRPQRRPCLLSVVVVLQDGDQEPFGVERQEPIGQRRIVVAQYSSRSSLPGWSGTRPVSAAERPPSMIRCCTDDQR